MRAHRDFFNSVRLRTSMYLVESRYSSITALMMGYDCAHSGGVLAGFTEWLVVRTSTGANLSWPALVLKVAFPEVADPRDSLRKDPEKEQIGIAVLFELVDEFLRLRSEPDGLRRIYLAYEAWLREQDWYTPASPQWIELGFWKQEE